MIAYLLLAVSVAAFLYAGRLAWEIVRPAGASRDRIARAVRPAEGRPINWNAPARTFNRPGEN